VGSLGTKFDELRHNEIVVNEVECFDQRVGDEVKRAIIRVKQMLDVGGVTSTAGQHKRSISEDTVNE
jgi:hypothetical protein